MNDSVFIRELRVYGVVGVHPWERLRPRPLVFDVEIRWNNRAAAAKDELSEAVNYDAVAAAIRAVVAAGEPLLIETLAEQCADAVLARYPQAGLRLNLFKPGAVKGAAGAGVAIERGAGFTD